MSLVPTTFTAKQTSRPVRVSIERSGSLKGFCAGLARSVAVVSRESVIALIKAAHTTEVVPKPEHMEHPLTHALPIPN
jgi:hypothetical protein